MIITSRNKPILEIKSQKQFLDFLKSKDEYLYNLSPELKSWFKLNKNSMFKITFFYKPLYKELFGELPKSKILPKFWEMRGYTGLQAKKKAKEINKIMCQISTQEMSTLSKEQRKKRYDSNSRDYFKKKHGENSEEMYKSFNEVRTNKSLKNKIEYWLNKGFSEQEAKEKVSSIQSQRATEFWSSEASKDRLTDTQVKYWISKGYSEVDAIKKVSEVQRRFSLDICIEKYGLDEGTKIWEQRQIKWQETLKSKPQEEIDRINQLKSTGRMSQYFKGNPEAKLVPGIVYYLRFWNDEIEFWKIGITSRSIEERFGSKRMNTKHNLNYEVIKEINGLKFGECFKEEQRILNENIDNRVNINYNGFKSTECFKKDVLNES